MNAAAIQYPKSVDGKQIVEKVKVLKRKIIEDNKPVVSKVITTITKLYNPPVNFRCFLPFHKLKNGKKLIFSYI